MKDPLPTFIPPLEPLDQNRASVMPSLIPAVVCTITVVNRDLGSGSQAFKSRVKVFLFVEHLFSRESL